MEGGLKRPPFFMLALLALIAAVIALVIARSARREVRELRALIALRDSPSVAAPEPVVEPPAAAAQKEEPPPVPAPAAEIPIYQAPPAAAARTWNIDWENLVGIKLFSWIAGIALVLSAVFLFRYSVEHGWLRPAVRAAFGLITGVSLLVACELRVARNYRFTANAMDGAGIAILYATLFALHGRWHLWPASVAFLGMLLVTAAAVFLSTRRDSVFIALLGLLGGFATPALLSSGENRPIALFSYLLLLNGGIAWIAYRKRWPILTALTVALTAAYQWTWVHRFLTTGQLPLAAAIFVGFAVVGASSLWSSATAEPRSAFRKISAAGAVLPLLFAFFTAIVPEYGARYNVLFSFLLLVAAGLAAIAMWRGPEWLHSVGGAATLITFFIWLTVSYTHESWPWSLAWLAAFVALYLTVGVRLRTAAMYAAPLLFFVFIGLAVHERGHAVTLSGALLALAVVVLVFALTQSRPYVAASAIALGSIAVMSMASAPAATVIATQSALLAMLLFVAWISEKHVLAVAAVPFVVAALIASERLTDPQQLLFGTLLYAMFFAYPLTLGARVKRSLAPHLAAALAGLVFFVHAYEMRTELGYDDVIGLLPIALALLSIVHVWQLLRLEAMPSRLALAAGTVLAWLTIAIPVQLEKEWITIAWALEAAALAWLFRRIPHRGLVFWSGALAIAALARLVFNPAVFTYHAKSATPVLNWYLFTYVTCAAAMFVTVRLLPESERQLRRIAASAGAIELFFLLNIEIADYYSIGDTLTFNFLSSSLAQDLTYTMGWAVFALTMLVAGIAMHSRATRVAALGLLLVTILKCFLHDLARLGGLYRVGSLFGLAVSLVAVGLMLQKFVMMRRESTASSTP